VLPLRAGAASAVLPTELGSIAAVDPELMGAVLIGTVVYSGAIRSWVVVSLHRTPQEAEEREEI
jgi:hypothetical protein